jgi:hypothetical protein
MGAIFIAAITSSISETWSSLNVTPGNRVGLSGGVLNVGKDIGGWYSTISVGDIINERSVGYFNMRAWRYIEK